MIFLGSEVMEELTKELLEEEYYNNGLSVREIAKKYGVSKGRIDYLFDKYGIERRSLSEAMILKANKEREERIEEARVILEEDLKKIHIKKRKIKPIKRRHLLVPLSNSKECTVTVVISDLHLGDSNHLPDTYWSTIANLKEVLSYINKNYSIKAFYIVLNGDLVSGRDVYRFQELRNLLDRGHWQVFLAEYVLKKTFKMLEDIRPITRVYLVKGTHESLANNFVLYLKRMLGDKAYYLSHGGVVNIADPIGEYNVLFTHGSSYSEYCPIPPKLMRDVLAEINKQKERGVYIERVCTGHTHWLSSNLIIGDVYWDVTGGFQKWEYTLHQRPSGVILYFYSSKEVSSIPIRSDPEIEDEEQSEVGLEYKNLKYYGECLLEHLKKIEGR